MRQFILFFILITAVDQLTKYSSRFLGAETTINHGVSFALLGGQSQLIIILLTIIVIIVLALRYGHFWARHPITAGIFFGGAFSNLVDRLWFGGVRDWLSIPLLPIKNNLADIAIVASLGIILWCYWRKGDNE